VSRHAPGFGSVGEALSRVLADDLPEGIARAEEAARYAAEIRAATSESRRASLAKTTRQTSRAPWERPCTCGHCMSCIGE